MARSFEVTLSEFAIGALAPGEPPDSERLRRQLVAALRFYLREAGAGRPGWSVPSALRQARGTREVSVELDDELAARLEAEAGRQDVTLSRLATQAAIYFAAELDSGRVTQRVLDDLEDEGRPAP